MSADSLAGQCVYCERWYSLRNDGRLRVHGSRGAERCRGSGHKPGNHTLVPMSPAEARKRWEARR